MTKTMMAGLAAFSLYAAQPAATALVSVKLDGDPTERAFFRDFRDVNHQNGLGIE